MATYSDAVNNARLAALETVAGASPLLRIYSGTAPTNARTALSGNTLLAEGALPSDWLANAATGSQAKAGTWTVTGLPAAGAGTAGTFGRIYDAAGTTCHMQFTFGTSGEMTIATNSIVDGTSYNVSTFTRNSGN